MNNTKDKLTGIIKEASEWHPPEPTENPPGPSPKKGVSKPGPLSDEALHGVLGNLVKAIEPHTESDPVAILVQALISFGSTVGRNPYFRVENTRHYLNENIVLVGKTGKGRKGTAFDRAIAHFKEIDPEWDYTFGLSSGEGLIHAVRDPMGQDEGILDKRLLVVETEFASTLRIMKREGNSLSGILRQSWDSGNIRTLVKKDPAKATGAHISIIGHATRDELLKYLTDTEAGNGFANRFMWFWVERSRELPMGGNLDDEILKPITRQLSDAVKFASVVEEIKFNDEAEAEWRKVYGALSSDKPGLFGSLVARSEPHVIRLSCNYALLDMSTEIRLEHLAAALALWEYSEDSCKYIFGNAIGDPQADEILRVLQLNPDGMSRTDISNHFGRNITSHRISQALTKLNELGLAHMKKEPTGGAPVEIWFPGPAVS